MNKSYLDLNNNFVRIEDLVCFAIKKPGIYPYGLEFGIVESIGKKMATIRQANSKPKKVRRYFADTLLHRF